MPKIKYPALYADLEPATAPDGKRGSTVICTATRHILGFVWWSADSKGVVWHFRVDDCTGARTTERNAVQALRDWQKGPLHLEPETAPPPRPRRVPIQERLETIFAPRPVVDHAPAPVVRVAPVVVTPAPRQQITWGHGSAADVTAAVARAFNKHKQESK